MKSGIPRSIGNRWGTFDSCCDRLGQFNFEQLITVTVTTSDPNRVKKGKGNGKGKVAPKAKCKAIAKATPKPPSRKRNSEVLDETALDDTAYYSEKKGKYKRETHKSIKQPAFWLLMRISGRCRKPWVWLLHFLQSKRPKMGELVCGKCELIASGFEEYLSDDRKWEDLRLGLGHALLEGACPGTLAANEAIVSFVACHSVDFERRVARTVLCWPMLVVWMSFSPPTTVCEQRRWRAQDFIGMQHTMATNNKLMIIFRAEFQVVADTGTCPTSLYEYAQDIRLAFWPDSQEVESKNKTVTMSFQRCATVGAALVKARLVNKSKVFESALTEREAAQRIPALVESCAAASATPEFAALRDDPCRWAAESSPPVQTSQIRPGGAAALDALVPLADAVGAADGVAAARPSFALVREDLLDADDLEWSSNWTLTWFRSFLALCEHGRPTAAHIFAFRKPRQRNFVNDKGWLCGTTHHFVGWCLMLQFTSATTAEVVTPLQKWNTLEVLANMRIHVVERAAVCEFLDVEWPTRVECRIIRKQKQFDIQEVHPDKVRLKRALLSKLGGKAGKSKSYPKGPGVVVEQRFA